MKTTEIIFNNLAYLKVMQETVLQSKNHVQFLATAAVGVAPQLVENLKSVCETLQAVADAVEHQMTYNREMRVKYATEVALKNQAYDFIATQKLVQKFATHRAAYPERLYIDLQGSDILRGK